MPEAHDKVWTAVRDEAMAIALHEGGTENAKQAIKLRDEREIATARWRVAKREFDAARAGMPQLADVPVNGAMQVRSKQIAEAMTSHLAVKLFHPSKVNASGWAETWQTYLDLDESWLTWVPLYVARICIEADEAWFKHKDNAPWERGTTEFPHPEDLRAMWKQLLEDRASRRQAKVAAARRMAAQAEAEATR